MLKEIPLSIPNLTGNELKYVEEAINSGWVSTSGPYVNLFERNIAEYVHAKGAVSCQNGTSGIHTALLVSGITSDDAVIVPTLTFIAAVNPVKYIGAEPIFMDCDDSLCIDPVKLEQYFAEECSFIDGKLFGDKKRHIKAIIVVHVFGNMADMEAIIDIAARYNLQVIEDATEAIGTYYTEGRYKGCYAGTIGDIGVYSFNGNKIITTGGGGMIVSNNEEYLSHAKHLTTQAKSDEIYYTHDEIGYNYRMTNLQAALGLAQLEQLEGFIEIKHKNHIDYMNNGINLLPFKTNIRSNYWFYSYCSKNRDGLIKYLHDNHVQSRPIWKLIHTLTPYKNNEAYKVEKAYRYYERVVNIPCSTNLSSEEIKRVASLIRTYEEG